jgi:periplasmic divalent cation tolerance protein
MSFMGEIPADAVVVFSTTPRQGGDAIARVLITEHLAACINILEVRSLFRWEGEMNDEPEDLMVIKTMAENVEDLVMRIRQLHPYDLPEIIALPLKGGYPPYLEWIRQETRR